MNQNLLRISFTLSFILVVMAGGLKILHFGAADLLLAVALLLSYGCLSYAVFERLFSKNLSRRQRTGWLLAFLFTGWAALLVYAYFNGKKATGKKTGNTLPLR